MFDGAIIVENLGKMYKLFKKPRDKIIHALGLTRIIFWRRNSYKEFWALRDINLQVNRGERIGIIGRNGAGKSTLLKIITGNIVPTEGKVTVNGNVQALMELGTGFHPEFTGRENIRAYLAYHGLSAKKISELEEEIIDFSELEDFIDQPIKTYSAGMYTRLAFSVATAIEPEILIIDEILGAGDAYFNAKSVNRKRQLTEFSGATVMFVSHDLTSVQALCNRIIWIERGVIKADGEPLEVIKDYLAEVRKDEELRIRKRHQRAIKSITDIQSHGRQVLHFRLVFDSDDLKIGIHKLRTIGLNVNSSLIAKLQIGAPMDNDPTQVGYIVEESHLSTWGGAEKDDLGYYRKLKTTKGVPQGAHFEFRLNNTIKSSDMLTIAIETQSSNSKIALEFLNPNVNQYERIGYLETSNSIFRFQLKESSQKPDETVDFSSMAFQEETIDGKIASIKLASSRDVRFTNQCRVSSMDIQDINGNSIRAFNYGEQIGNVSFVVEFDKAIKKLFICLYLFSSNGSALLSDHYEVNNEKMVTNIKVLYGLQNLKIGPGEYLVSFGVYEALDVTDNSREQSALALLDRAVSFKIEKPLGFNLNTGLLANYVTTVVTSMEGGEPLECHSCL